MRSPAVKFEPGRSPAALSRWEAWALMLEPRASRPPMRACPAQKSVKSAALTQNPAMRGAQEFFNRIGPDLPLMFGPGAAGLRHVTDTRLDARARVAALVSGPTGSASPILVVARRVQTLGRLTNRRGRPKPRDNAVIQGDRSTLLTDGRPFAWDSVLRP
jgi:hypothetical protein